jgi:hypothetical protein
VEDIFLYHYQYLLLSFAISRGRYSLCRGILRPLVPLLVIQTVFGRVDGFVTKQDSFWQSESVNCAVYTRSSIGTHSTTPREGLKSSNQLEVE